MITEAKNIKFAINDAEPAITSPLFGGTFVTAIATLISVARDYIEKGEGGNDAAVEVLEEVKMSVEEMESSFDSAYGHLDNVQSAIDQAKFEWDDAMSALNIQIEELS